MTMIETLGHLAEDQDRLACLALADWYEEQGDWEEATFVRRASGILFSLLPSGGILVSLVMDSGVLSPREREILCRITNAIGRAYWRARGR